MAGDYVGVQSSPLTVRARRLLDGVVPEELMAPYVSLLVRERCLLAEARHLFGDDHSSNRLLTEGMAYLQDDGADGRSVLVPASPDLVLQRALARHAEDLAAEHRRLLDGQERLREAHAAQEAAADRSMDQLVQIITDQSRIHALEGTLAGSAQRDWLLLGDGVGGGRPTEHPTLRFGTVRCRAIYEMNRVEESAARERIDALVRAGGTVRLLPQLAVSMRLADEAIALLPLAESESAGALLVQSSVIVGALREYFELLWANATPYGIQEDDEGPLPPTQMKILRLLVQGMTEKAIADQVGVSVATVGRQVNAIRDALGVENRFALGVVAVQRGLLD
ncbi:LuxR C-terminal-related transcriptional regulator [Spirillospora sp. NPDC052242]